MRRAGGAIHTRAEVAEFILDLAGWAGRLDAGSARLLEPSAGEADFLVPAARRALAGLANATLGDRPLKKTAPSTCESLVVFSRDADQESRIFIPCFGDVHPLEGIWRGVGRSKAENLEFVEMR